MARAEPANASWALHLSIARTPVYLLPELPVNRAEVPIFSGSVMPSAGIILAYNFWSGSIVQNRIPCGSARRRPGVRICSEGGNDEEVCRSGTCGLLMLVADTAGAQAPVDLKGNTQKLANAWMQAYNNKDAATVAKMYADDAVFSNPGWTASGRAAKEGHCRRRFQSKHYNCRPVSPRRRHELRMGWVDRRHEDALRKGSAGPGALDGRELMPGRQLSHPDHNSNMAMPPPK